MQLMSSGDHEAQSKQRRRCWTEEQLVAVVADGPDRDLTRESLKPSSRMKLTGWLCLSELSAALIASMRSMNMFQYCSPAECMIARDCS